MPKKKPPPSDDEQPSSETVRVQADLMVMLREICQDSRDSRNRPLKLTAVVDEILRPVVTRRYQAILKKKEADKETDE